MDRPGPPTAVIVDEWPLVRLGMTQALRSANIMVVAEAAKGEPGVHQAGTRRAHYLLLGSHNDLPLAETARRARALAVPVKVLVLIDRITQDELAALRSVGIDALLPRAVGPAELADAVSRVARGERVVAPALLSLLVGVLGPVDVASGAGGPGSSATADRRESLTRKELEVLARLAEGRSNREIADALFITPATVKSHLAHIYDKLGVTGRQEAMARAVATGLLG